MPRVLVNVEARTLNKSVLDREMSLPFGIAPMGMCDIVWPGADLMFAKIASTTLENCYRESERQAWFQLYPSTLNE